MNVTKIATDDPLADYDRFGFSLFKPDNGNVHRAAANIIVSKSRAARGSVCNVLLSAEIGFRANLRFSVARLAV